MPSKERTDVLPISSDRKAKDVRFAVFVLGTYAKLCHAGCEIVMHVQVQIRVIVAMRNDRRETTLDWWYLVEE